jgi:xylan 1,4-beta-xylosidase
VGGPGVTNLDPARRSGQFLDAFCNHVVNGANYYTGGQGTPIDFMSFHVKGGGYRADPKRHKENPPSVKRILNDTRTGHEIITRYPPLDELECVLSEIDPDGWAAGGAWDNINLNFRNTEYYPSFVVTAFDKVSQFAREKRWDVRLLTWAFLFIGERCFEGTRALSTQGIDKPILNLFRLYALMGDRAVSLRSTGAQDPLSYADENGFGAPPDISGFAALSEPSALSILIYNHHDDWDLDANYTIRLEVDNIPFASAGVTVSHYRLDRAHSNAYAEWVRQGSPMYPTVEQRQAIQAREGLEKLEPDQTFSANNGSLVLTFMLPVHVISVLILLPA